MCVDCEQKEILMEEVKGYKNQTMKQRKDYESKHAVLKKELTEMERVLEEEKVSKEEDSSVVVVLEEKNSKEGDDDEEGEGSERKVPAVYDVLHAI